MEARRKVIVRVDSDAAALGVVAPPAIAPNRMLGMVHLGRENLHLAHVAEGFALPMLKEPGYSSGFYVNQVRKRLSGSRRTKHFKVGHAGTLDPFADGVLVLLGGSATKEQNRYMSLTKEYEATIALGETTPSLDPDTEISERDAGFQLDPNALGPVIAAWTGRVQQVPPAYSAKHVDGQRAYSLAREGVAVELKPVEVQIDELNVIETSPRSVRIRVRCGSGTYIRALARDIATGLGTVGHLSALTRTHAGGFRIDQCVRLRELLDSQHPDRPRKETATTEARHDAPDPAATGEDDG